MAGYNFGGGTASMFPSQNFGQQSSSGFGSNMMAGMRKVQESGSPGLGMMNRGMSQGWGTPNSPGGFGTANRSTGFGQITKQGGPVGTLNNSLQPYNPYPGYAGPKQWDTGTGMGFDNKNYVPPPPGWIPPGMDPGNYGNKDQGGGQPGDTRQGSSIMRNGQRVGHYGNKNEAIYDQGQSGGDNGGGGLPDGPYGPPGTAGNPRPDGSYDAYPGSSDMPSARREGDWLVTSGGWSGTSRRNMKTGQQQHYDPMKNAWVDGGGIQYGGGGGMQTLSSGQQAPLNQPMMNPQGMTRAPQSMLPSNPNAAFAGGEGQARFGMNQGGGNIYNSLPPYAMQIMQQNQARMNDPTRPQTIGGGGMQRPMMPGYR